MLSTLMALPLAAAAVAIVTFAARLSRGEARPSRGQLCWLAVPVLVLGVLAVLCVLGLYQGGPLEPLVLIAAALGASWVMLRRDRVRDAVAAWGEKRGWSPARTHALFTLVALLACTLLGHLAMELPYNYEILWMAPQYALLQCGLVLLALAALHFLFQRRGAGMVVGVDLCFVIGLAQFFVASFKSAAILPNDLFVLGTAAAVSGSYTYAVGGGVTLGLAAVLLAAAVGSLVSPAPAASRGRRVAANLGCAVMLLAALAVSVTVPSYFDQLGVQMKYWYSLDYYRKQGFLTSFIAVAQDLPIDVPEGYSDEGAESLEESYVERYDEDEGASEERQAAEAQFDEERPSVVCIMNESFADLSELDGASWGYDGPSFVSSLDDTLARGSLAVSVLGGGTCNTEFEFLTGVPLAYIGDGKYPYSLYDLSESPSLARQFSELGYQTTAMHPNYATNWNRDRVYEALGFDEFLDIDDFAGAETYHSGVSDAATYDTCLELLENSDEPQFIFDVTMQNHSGYDQNNVGAVKQYHVDGMSDYDNARLSEYLACIDESDRALEEFLGELSELDRPVVVIFFGDHQPALSTIVDAAVSGEQVYDENGNAVGGGTGGGNASGDAEATLETYRSTYLVWANYDVAGNAQDGAKLDASPAYLGSVAADLIGAPLTDYQKAQLAIREEVPALSLLGMELADGTWVDPDDEAALPQAYDDLARITYLEFASKLR